MSLSVGRSVCVFDFVCLFVCLSVCLLVGQSVRLTLCLSVGSSVCVFDFMSVCSSGRLSVCMSTCHSKQQISQMHKDSHLQMEL